MGLESSGTFTSALYYVITISCLFVPSQNIIGKDPETHGSVFVPIILGSDKTTVSVGTGHIEYWPIYLSIGNIHNNVRRAHGGGVALLGFHCIPKSTNHLYFFSGIFADYSQLRGNIKMMQSSTSFGASFSIPLFPAFSRV
jgi:hypothetical protein